MGPEQDETRPAQIRQYATTLHPPPGTTLSHRDLGPPEDGDGWELDGLQAQDAAGNLVYLWSRAAPGGHGDPESSGKLPLAMVQAVAQLVLGELEERLAGQRMVDGIDKPTDDGLRRAVRVVQTLGVQIGEAQIPAELASLVE